jgi:RNA polymerase primary sigma factor
LTHRRRCKPKVSELARAMKLPVSKIRELMQIDQGTTSLDQPIGEEGEASMLDLIEDVSTGTSQEHVDEIFRGERITGLLDKINPRERAILELRFGLKDGEIHTLNEAAQIFNITRERVRQIEASALKKLRVLADTQPKGISPR